MKNKKQKKETKAIAISQILILVIATIAFSWMLGSEIKTVSAADPATIGCGSGGVCVTSCSGSGNDPIEGTCPTGQICCNAKSNDVEGGTNLLSTVTTGVGLVSSGVSAWSAYQGGIYQKAMANVVNAGTGPTATAGTATSTVSASTANTAATSSSLINAEALAASNPVAQASFTEGWGIFGTEGATTEASNVFGGIMGDVVAGVVWAALAYAVVWGITELMGASQRNQENILTAAGVGAAAGIIFVVLISEASSGPVGWVAGVVTVAVALIWGVVSYQNYAQEVYTYRPSLWQPPTGGAECNKCNSMKVGTGENQVNGCSEYICHSYGAACEWMNDETQYETCIEVNPGDSSPPVIEPAREIYGEPVFRTTQFGYVSSASGTRIVYNGEGGGVAKCVPAFTTMKIALTTQENAHCKISIEPNNGSAINAFAAMKDMAEGNVYTKNHTMQLPSSVTADRESFESSGYTLNNGGVYKFYIRCEDARGNINSQDYEVQFCVQIGPDTTPPEIVGTNPAQNSYIPYNTSIIRGFQVYTNEPADCKWDTREISYNYMTNNFSKCSQNLNDYLVGFDYGCQVNLTGFKNGVENKYYVACKDHPEYKGNITQESKRNTGRPYEVILKGTNRLIIQTVRINGMPNGTTIRGREETAKVNLEVVTAGGAEDGNARCLYAENNVNPSYSLFSNEGSREYLSSNKEELYMPEGLYTYLIKCYDVAENNAETIINFTVEVDLLSPIVVRAYKDEQSESLKMITDEISQCVYSTTSCSYDVNEGTEISTDDGKEHYIDWNVERDLYVKCSDEYQNYPAEGECSIIIRPFEISKVI